MRDIHIRACHLEPSAISGGLLQRARILDGFIVAHSLLGVSECHSLKGRHASGLLIHS